MPLVTATAPVAATILVSPWVTFEQHARSFETNQYCDLLSAGGLADWSTSYLGGAERDPYNTPLSAPTGWWKDAPMGHVVVIAGQDEIFVDDDESFAKNLKVDFNFYHSMGLY